MYIMAILHRPGTLTFDAEHIDFRRRRLVAPNNSQRFWRPAAPILEGSLSNSEMSTKILSSVLLGHP
jgi:hypothetical protein